MSKKQEELKVIQSKLNHWYNILYGNYEDLTNLISNWDPDLKSNWDNLGRFWFNYLSSENALRSKMMNWRKSLVEKYKIFSLEEYEKRLKQTDVAKYSQILKKMRRSLHHETSKEEWGLDLRIGLKLKADINEEGAKITIIIVDNHEISFTPEKIQLQEIITYHTISQRMFISWINTMIDKSLNPEDRMNDNAIDVLDDYFPLEKRKYFNGIIFYMCI